MFRISLSTARTVYPTLLIGSVILCNTVPFFVIVLALSMTAVIFRMTLSLLCPTLCCSFTSRASSRREEDDSDTLLGQQPINVEGGAIAIHSPRPRLHYIDNLKSVLTVIVVLHHTLGAFAGVGSLGLSVGNFRSTFQVFAGVFQILNQSYFMSLFFFLSALLSPASLERKGLRAFLADKYKRLGVPFLLYFFILGPTLTCINDLVFIGRPTSYQPNAGPAWFLCWLLVFNTAYALIDTSTGNPQYANFLVFPRPTLLTLCALGMVAGALQAVQIMFLPIYPFMPITFGSLPFDVLFFVGGLVAEKSGWLTHTAHTGDSASAATNHTQQVVWAKRGVVALSLAFITGLITLYTQGGGAYLLSRNPCDHFPDRGLGDGVENPTPLWIALLTLSLICVAGGVYIMCISVAGLDVFRERFSEEGGWWRVAASASFGVYLFHASLVLPLTGVFVLIVRKVLGGGMGMWSDAKGGALWDTPSCLVKGGAAGGGAVMQEVVLFGGFFAVSAVTLAIVYPLALGLKRLPGFKEVL